MTHPYSEFLHLIERPGRYIGGEYHSVVKPEARIRFALAFPDLYEIGMSHLGFKILYGILNGCEDIAAERVFAPWTDLEQELRTRKIRLVSHETATPLSSFDIIGFSLQYEMTYTNLLAMLDLGGVPIRGADRDDEHPLVIAGGPCAMSPEPLAPFVDAFVIGDGEEIAVELCRAWKTWRDEKLPRSEALRRLSSWQGVYVPSCYETEIDSRTDLEVVSGPKYPESHFPIQRRIVSDINKFPFPDNSPVPFTEVVFNRFAIELARGCTEGCRFCQAGMIYRPVRERDPSTVVKTLLSGIDKGGYEKASLTTLSTADYSAVSPLLKNLLPTLRERDIGLGISSLRAYGLPEDVLDEMAAGDVSGLTFAPEAGTQRMRDVVAKNISEEEMIETARRVFSRGWQKIKLYFMIGLPTEKDEDVEGIAEISRRVKEAGREVTDRSIDVTVSISSHVPKPHTPFQWAGMDSLEEIERKQKMVSHMTRRYKLSFRSHPSDVSHIEGWLSRGDRRMARVLEEAYLSGCRFDGWGEKLNVAAWMEARTKCGVDEKVYLRPLPVDGRLPWQHIDPGVTTKFLATEYRRALQDRLSPPCGKPFGAKVHHTNLEEHEKDERKLVCYHCGIACDLSGMKTERAEFLRVMDATKPSEKKERLPDATLWGPKKTEIATPTFSYRLHYSKLSPASYLSHLDLIKMIERQFNRAKISVAMSQGFHPKPKLSFGPALSLGVESLGEVVDVVLREKIDLEELRERLNQVVDPGIRYEKIEILQPGMSSLAKSITASRFLLGFRSRSGLEMALARWNDPTPLEVSREAPKKVTILNARDSISEFSELPLSEIPLGLGNFDQIESAAQMTLAVRPEGGLRLKEALSLICTSEVPSRVVRLEFVQALEPVSSVFSPGMNALATQTSAQVAGSPTHRLK